MPETDGNLHAKARAELVAVIQEGCAAGNEEWPDRVGAGLYAVVAFMGDNQEMAQHLLNDRPISQSGGSFRELVYSVAKILNQAVPLDARLGPTAPAAAVAGVGMLIGDCLRVGRFQRLPDLRPDLHLMILLPYLGFDEAKLRAQAFQDARSS